MMDYTKEMSFGELDVLLQLMEDKKVKHWREMELEMARLDGFEDCLIQMVDRLIVFDFSIEEIAKILELSEAQAAWLGEKRAFAAKCGK